MSSLPTAPLLDASCSSGEVIVAYRWWWDYVPGQPPDAVEVSPCCAEPLFGAPGPKQVRLEIEDDTGATAALVLEYDHQP